MWLISSETTSANLEITENFPLLKYRTKIVLAQPANKMFVCSKLCQSEAYVFRQYTMYRFGSSKEISATFVRFLSKVTAANMGIPFELSAPPPMNSTLPSSDAARARASGTVCHK